MRQQHSKQQRLEIPTSNLWIKSQTRKVLTTLIVAACYFITETSAFITQNNHEMIFVNSPDAAFSLASRNNLNRNNKIHPQHHYHGLPSFFFAATRLYLKSTKYEKRKSGEEMTTIRDLVQDFAKEFEQDTKKLTNMEETLTGKNKKKKRRSRGREIKPQQKYVYASQRKSLRKLTNAVTEDDGEDGTVKQQTTASNDNDNNPIMVARKLGMNINQQYLEPIVVYDQELGESRIAQQPVIVGELKVDDDGDEQSDTTKKSGMTEKLAYIVYKPAGWSILETKKNKKNKATAFQVQAGNLQEEEHKDRGTNTNQKMNTESKVHNPNANIKKAKYYDSETKKIEYLEYDESQILSLLNPEELKDFERDGGLQGLNKQLSSAQNAMRAKYVEEIFSKSKNKGGIDSRHMEEDKIESMVEDSIKSLHAEDFLEVDPNVLKEERSPLSLNKNQQYSTAPYFSPQVHPSLITWLKETKASEGILLRGGTNWRALAGAVNIDDSGLVLLCPKTRINNVHVDEVEYVAVVGNGGYLAPSNKKKNNAKKRKSLLSQQIQQEEEDQYKLSIGAKLRKGRSNDPIFISQITIPNQLSTCDDVVILCQNEYSNGIRGDVNANPLDRRAERRLTHCKSMSASSLTQDDYVECNCPPEKEVPDDIAILAGRKRRQGLKQCFEKGSFLGREGLKCSQHTTAFREINGAGDGFPGWIVDRYDKWLFVQHYQQEGEEVLNVEDINSRIIQELGGPLPSIHDGYTKGVYYLPVTQNRSDMKNLKPILIEGQPIPSDTILPIHENGIIYHVNFENMSTGIFLDQRHSRSWLIDHCTNETRVLNCFAHCGAFSVSAACAGAQTVSLDLEKKWLERIYPQMEANGVQMMDMNFKERHDCIYGDCFDWLTRLAKRSEKYDIVILDPPSTSVSSSKKGRKRWSARNDYDQLVELASKLVKKGGLLWTSTNCASLTSLSFARICKKGFERNKRLMQEGEVKLERVVPMPLDFPSVGPSPVKNFVWRIL